MQNVKVEVKGDKLIVEVDLKVAGQPSKTGKSMVIASTRGIVEVAPGVKMGLNVIKMK